MQYILFSVSSWDDWKSSEADLMHVHTENVYGLCKEWHVPLGLFPKQICKSKVLNAWAKSFPFQMLLTHVNNNNNTRVIISLISLGLNKEWETRTISKSDLRKNSPSCMRQKTGWNTCYSLFKCTWDTLRHVHIHNNTCMITPLISRKVCVKIRKSTGLEAWGKSALGMPKTYARAHWQQRVRFE